MSPINGYSDRTASGTPEYISGIGTHRYRIVGEKNAASPLSTKKRGGFQARVSAGARRGCGGHPVGARERFAAQQCTPSTRRFCFAVHPPSARTHAKEHDHSKRKYSSIPRVSSFGSQNVVTILTTSWMFTLFKSFQRCRIRGWMICVCDAMLRDLVYIYTHLIKVGFFHGARVWVRSWLFSYHTFHVWSLLSACLLASVWRFEWSF